MAADSRDLDEVRRIVLDGLRDRQVRVYLFGSWAKGGGSRISDIDVAVEALEPLPPGLLAEIHEALEESGVLLPVDLIDLSRATPEFCQIVRSEGISWTA